MRCTSTTSLIFFLPTSLHTVLCENRCNCTACNTKVEHKWKLSNTSTPKKHWRAVVTYKWQSRQITGTQPFKTLCFMKQFPKDNVPKFRIVQRKRKNVYQSAGKQTNTLVFLKLCSSNIYLLPVRFGKLQTEYSPLVCQTKHPSASVRSIWVAVICLKTDISTECNAALSSILFEMRSEHQTGRFKCMFGNGDHIYYWISILFPAIVCWFMVYFDFSQLANAESCKNNKTIESRKRTGSLIKFWWLKLV